MFLAVAHQPASSYYSGLIGLGGVVIGVVLTSAVRIFEGGLESKRKRQHWHHENDYAVLIELQNGLLELMDRVVNPEADERLLPVLLKFAGLKARVHDDIARDMARKFYDCASDAGGAGVTDEARRKFINDMSHAGAGLNLRIAELIQQMRDSEAKRLPVKSELV